MSVRPDARAAQPLRFGLDLPAQLHPALFEDRRARFVGDIITINPSSRPPPARVVGQRQRNAMTSPPPSPPGQVPLGGLNGLDATASDASKFGGKGDAAANNAFTGTITTTVIEVLPNGNLLVSGEKQIAINQGNEFIRFSGIVNPVSVTGANTVQSVTQVADARIEYRANGYIDETQQMGWLQRFFGTCCRSEEPAMSRLFRLAAACACGRLRPAGQHPGQPPPSASRISPASAACATTSWSATAWSVGLDGSGDQTTQTPSRCRASSTCSATSASRCRRASRCSSRTSPR